MTGSGEREPQGYGRRVRVVPRRLCNKAPVRLPARLLDLGMGSQKFIQILNSEAEEVHAEAYESILALGHLDIL
jgi:hypothetical protein